MGLDLRKKKTPRRKMSDCKQDVNVFRLTHPELAIKYNVLRLIMAGQLRDPVEFIKTETNNFLMRGYVLLHLDEVRGWVAKFVTL